MGGGRVTAHKAQVNLILVLVLVMVLNPGPCQIVNNFGHEHDNDLRQFDKLTADQNQDHD